jgi:2'-hydroxyisoflavone reductase
VRLLIIGGTRFVGRHISQAAIERGHDVTLFHRGVTNPQLFPEAEHVHGDRQAGGLSALAGRGFDAIVDPSAYVPADVEAAAGIAAGRYLLISTGSVYRDPVARGSDETAPLQEGSEGYGALKVLCERAAERRFPGRTLVLRPGLVVGPHDHTERFTYWPRRAARGGPILAAESDQPVQFIDARDLGSWAIAALEAGTTGVFNAVGPAEPTTMAQLLAACIAVTGSDAEPVWAGDRFLLDNGVEPWADLPLWLPAPEAGFLAVDAARARAAGLRTRSPSQTIADILRWDAERDPAQRRDAMPQDRERRLLSGLRGS